MSISGFICVYTCSKVNWPLPWQLVLRMTACQQGLSHRCLCHHFHPSASTQPRLGGQFSSGNLLPNDIFWNIKKEVYYHEIWTCFTHFFSVCLTAFHQPYDRSQEVKQCLLNLDYCFYKYRQILKIIQYKDSFHIWYILSQNWGKNPKSNWLQNFMHQIITVR